MRKLDLDSLTGTRFFAAVSVVFYHFGKNLPEFGPAHPLLQSVVLSGYESVAYFFCLSGFVMAVVYGDPKGRSPLAIKAYSWARFGRIYPVYLLALIMALCQPAWRSTALNIALSALLLQSIVPGHTIAINPPAWSLSTESFFYLAFPFLRRRMQALSPRALLATAAAVWIASLAPLVVLANTWVGPYLSPSFDLLYYSPLFNLDLFIVGMAAGFALQRSAGRLPNWPRWINEGVSTFVLAVFVASLVFQGWLGSRTSLNIPFGTGVMAPVHLLVIATIASVPSVWSRLLGSRTFVFLGGASYAIYLLQYPVCTWFALHLQPRLSFGMEGSFTLYLGLLIAVSCLVFHFYESPLRNWIRRGGRSRSSKDLIARGPKLT